jgi:hypothetical protein
LVHLIRSIRGEGGGWQRRRMAEEEVGEHYIFGVTLHRLVKGHVEWFASIIKQQQKQQKCGTIHRNEYRYSAGTDL